MIKSAFLALLMFTGCASIDNRHARPETGESVVFVGEEPAGLPHLPLRNYPIHVRSTYLPETGTVEYIDRRDFILNWQDGTLRRAPGSRAPDFRTNTLFGKEE